MSESVVTVVQNASEPQYDIVVDGEVAGVAAYEDRDDLRVFTHTTIEEAYEGRGLGKVLVGAALDTERDAGRKIVAECSYVEGFVQKNPQYADLLA